MCLAGSAVQIEQAMYKNEKDQEFMKAPIEENVGYPWKSILITALVAALLLWIFR
jgi:hypothetical protein